MTAAERRARNRAAGLCAALRARGDTLSLDAAAEIEGTLEAFAGLVSAQIKLRADLAAKESNLRTTHDLWSRVAPAERMRAAHGRT